MRKRTLLPLIENIEKFNSLRTTLCRLIFLTNILRLLLKRPKETGGQRNCVPTARDTGCVVTKVTLRYPTCPLDCVKLQWVAPIVMDIEGSAFRGELLRPEINLTIKSIGFTCSQMIHLVLRYTCHLRQLVFDCNK